MLEHDRLIAAEPEQGEVRIDYAIRPKHLKDYIGQPRVREQLEIFIGAARLREESLDHTLVFGYCDTLSTLGAWHAMAPPPQWRPVCVGGE